MLPTVILISPSTIESADFHQFLEELGVDASGNPQDNGRYWIRGEQFLLITRNTDLIEQYATDDPELLVTIHALLGAPLQGCVVVDFRRTAESGIFAVEFANVLNQRWPIVAIDEAQNIYDGTGIARLLEEGRGFSLTTTKEPLS